MSTPGDTQARHAMLAAALAAVELGFAVFPVRRRDKKPALHGDTTDRPCPRTRICRQAHQGWEQRATRDPDEARWLWTSQRFAGCNIGIATGPSGRLVVDLDMPKSPADLPPQRWSRRGCRDGHDVFAAVCADAGHPVPWDTRRVRTARNGTHLYFRAPTGQAGAQLRITEGEQGNGLGWKVDTRAWGGYVIAPGSITDHGSYWVEADLPELDAPGWLVHRLTVRPPTAVTAPRQTSVDGLDSYVQAAIDGECEHLATAPPGHGRALFISGLVLGQLVGAHVLPTAQAQDALYAAAHPWIGGTCGCTEREVRRAITNGLRAGEQRPRRIAARRGVA